MEKINNVLKKKNNNKKLKSSTGEEDIIDVNSKIKNCYEIFENELSIYYFKIIY
jgi:hypothetical protein